MDQPRHILMSCDCVGGVWLYTLELVRGLAEFGVHVTLFSQGAPLRDDQRAAVEALPNCDIVETEYKLEWMPDPWADVDAAGNALQELAERVQPDVVHLNEFSHAALQWRQPTVLVAHSCVYSWFDAVKGSAPGLGWGEYWRRVRLALGNTPVRVTPTRALADALEKHYGPLPEIRVAHNARSFDDYAPAEKEPFILAAGRLWDEAKNIQALANVAPSLDWPVRVAGPVDHPAGGQMEFPNVELLGELPPQELSKLMGRAAVFAAPARYEPFGLGILEAALSGCALVLGDLPSLREVWGDAAFYVRPDDEAALVSHLKRLIAYPKLRAVYAAKARRRARHYSVRRQTRVYLNLYHRAQRNFLPSSPALN